MFITATIFPIFFIPLWVLTVVIVLAVVFLGKNEEIVPVTEEATVPMVSVATIGELSGSQGSLTVVGEVRSVTQAELRTQSSGEVTSVNVSAGQYVGAGTILAVNELGTAVGGKLYGISWHQSQDRHLRRPFL